MIPRLLELPQDSSFFLFGARNTGKSTLIEHSFPSEQSAWFDLLDPELEYRLASKPSDFYNIVTNLAEEKQYIIIDEVQKIPALLDVVQRLMKDKSRHFIMTGSSARKLKRGGANLLAGRALVYYLFPFSSIELGDEFKLEQALALGGLPDIINTQSPDKQIAFLQAYTQTYLQEEIAAEQLVRKFTPFRRFLEVAAQANGKIVNFANIARDVGIDEKTVGAYFTILEETLIGFFLEAYQASFRKRLSKKPKFYFLDTGVVRALTRQLTLPLIESTSAYGEVFEHFIILECLKLSRYKHREFRLSYLKTQSDAEIDLVVERPGKPLLLIEIKSSSNVQQHDIAKFITLSKELDNAEAVCFSRDQYAKKHQHVRVLPWQMGLQEYFMS